MIGSSVRRGDLDPHSNTAARLVNVVVVVRFVVSLHRPATTKTAVMKSQILCTYVCCSREAYRRTIVFIEYMYVYIHVQQIKTVNSPSFLFPLRNRRPIVC